MGEKEIKIGKVAEESGIEVDFLNQQEVKKLEKNIAVNALGAVHYKSDAHLFGAGFRQIGERIADGQKKHP
jgi:D-amino-acid dehydrogenase